MTLYRYFNNLHSLPNRLIFPFQFFITLNVAVGGRFFPDGWINQPYSRPWSWSSGKPMKEFWDARKSWEKTWDRPEMLVDHILVYAI